jgi:hypothetical protein
MNRSWLLAVPLLVLSKGVSAGVSPMTVSGSSALGRASLVAEQSPTIQSGRPIETMEQLPSGS